MFSSQRSSRPKWTAFAALLAFVFLLTPALSQIVAGQLVTVTIKGVSAEEKAKVDEVYPISEDGMINLPFIGKLQAAGLGPAKLAEKIQQAYKDAGIYKEAVVGVFSGHICGPGVNQVHVGGSVRTPGSQPFAEGLTVYQAIQAAGGFHEFGGEKRVKLYRAGKTRDLDFSEERDKALVTKPNDTIEVLAKPVFEK